MSYCKQEGKDQIIFVTKDDHEKPSTAKLGVDLDEDEPGLILESGEINWSCPCLGGMATGPCGVEFREAFSCFHYSAEEMKGSDCMEQFRTMHECMSKYPELYPSNDDEKDDENKNDDKNDDKSSSSNDSSAKLSEVQSSTAALSEKNVSTSS